MSTADEMLASLKQRVAAAERAKMLSDIQLSQASLEVETTSNFLKENFGVETAEQAKQLIATYRSRLEEKTAELEKAMEIFEEAK